MKKIYLTLIFLIGLFGSIHAQNIGLRLGGSYAFDPEDWGLQIGGLYKIGSSFDLATGLSMYFPEEFDGGTDRDYWMVDIDGHFNFYPNRGIMLYPLAGLNFTTYKHGENSDANTELGLNVGGGIQLKLFDPLAAFLELKYVLGDADQGVLGLGACYYLR